MSLTADHEIQSAPRRRRLLSSRRRRGLGLALLGLPATALFAVLVVIPIAITVGYSFNDVSFLRDEIEWLGFSNYTRLWGNDDFRHSLWVTLAIGAAAAVVPNAAGLGLAVLLDAKGRLYSFLRVMLFVPFVLSPVVVGLTFGSILTDSGILNSALESVGLSGPSWIGNPTLAVVSVGSALVWQLIAFATVIYIAALQAIPTDLYEAAAMDGAKGGLLFRLITWPLVAPAVTITTVVSVISALKLYDHVVALTDGGPGRATETVGLAIIRTGFSQNRAGLASAMAVVLLVLTALITAVSLNMLRKREVAL